MYTAGGGSQQQSYPVPVRNVIHLYTSFDDDIYLINIDVYSIPPPVCILLERTANQQARTSNLLLLRTAEVYK